MTTLIESNKKSASNVSGAGPTNRTSNVLTAIEPLSLPSVVGSKALFGNANNTDKTQGITTKVVLGKGYSTLL